MADDIVQVGVQGLTAHQGRIKPPHLILLQNLEYFLSLDKPIISNGFVECKGFYLTIENDFKEMSDLKQNYQLIISKASKDIIEDIMFPSNRILSIINLSFKSK